MEGIGFGVRCWWRVQYQKDAEWIPSGMVGERGTKGKLQLDDG